MIKSPKGIFSLIVACILLSPLNWAHSMEHEEGEGEQIQTKGTKKRRTDIPVVAKTSGIGEAFLVDSIGALTSAQTKRHSDILGKDADLYTCDQPTFDKLFPVCPAGDDPIHKSFFAGQIRNAHNDNGIGTGTIIGMEKVEGGVRLTGITALHNFVGFTQTKGLDISAKFTRKFCIGSKAHPEQKGLVFSLGTFDIDSVIVPAIPVKDICLFSGILSHNKELFTDETVFFDQFHDHLPAITASKVNNSDVVSKASMYHYPLGKKDQRQNEGEALGNGKHKIESLFGSSGAGIFNEKFEIIGIHTGVSGADLRRDMIAACPDDDDIPISNYNLFALISLDDYNELNTGVDLYGSKGNSDKKFYDALKGLAENISHN
ncbi:MAG: hypothetical protein BGO67_08755 [Alphaproteobacteria bacterium 41-28]|nr:MAG: hypothetical protein BGO67_08755 [Alphaproteobacteria bacterium 41-28]